MVSLEFFVLALAHHASARSRCTPVEDCWPSTSNWSDLNSTVQGKLIQNQPIAISCYQGDTYNVETCQDVSFNWASNSWIAEQPTGFSYPSIVTCPPINASISAGHYPQCDLGSSPAYSVNATGTSDVAAGIAFAKKHNIRLSIKNTGHDIVHRSEGYGSLSIWTKYIRDGLTFQQNYTPSDSNCKTKYTGSAVQIGGSYVWNDVYAFASKHNSIVVGGADPTVGTIGGYLQGGGHGPASHEFGLGADQVLEYKVVLASGQVVIANECQYSDLFTALRGGGGGTYGIVTSATVKVYPDRATLGHDLTVVALDKNGTEMLMNTITDVMTSYPALVDEGFAGTAVMTHGDGALVYQQPFLKLLEKNSSTLINQAKNVMNKKVVSQFLPLNGTSLLVQSDYVVYDSFRSWYTNHSHETDGNNRPNMASWFFTKQSLNRRSTNKKILDAFYAGQGVRTSTGSATLFNLVAGGKVLEAQPFTAINPAWRKTYVLMQQIDLWPDNAGYQQIAEVKKELTDSKLQVMMDASPGMGTYGNEADPWDPNWKDHWWGKDNYKNLVIVKKKYDPDDVFWCWRCVGNEAWAEVTGGTVYGPLQFVGKT